MMRSRAWIWALLSIAAALPAFGEGQVLIGPAGVPTPVVLPPGSYLVTGNITAVANGLPVLSIAIPPPAAAGQDVEIDLNGHVLNNLANPGAAVISFAGPAPRQIVIKNGTLVGGSEGIAAPGGARKVVIEDVQIGSSVTNAIHLSSVENFAIRRCVIAAPGGAGILVDDPGGINFQGVAEGNLIKMTARNGIVILGGGAGARATVRLERNQLDEINQPPSVAFPQPPGVPAGAISLFSVEPCLVEDNTIRGVGAGTVGAPGAGIGIYGQDAEGCKLIDNVVSDTGGDSIFLAGPVPGFPPCQDNLLIHNIVRGSFSDGIHISGSRNDVEGNVIHNTIPPSTGWGLHFGTGSTNNRYGRNSAVGNFGGAAPCAFLPSATTDFCDDAGAGGANISFGDNMMPGPGKM